MPRWIFYGTNRYEASNSKIYASLLPCTAFAFGADILSDYEYAEIGVQSFNIDQGAYSFRSCLNMLAFDALFYFFLAWYCNEVIPAEFGVAKHPLFLFFPSYSSPLPRLPPSTPLSTIRHRPTPPPSPCPPPPPPPSRSSPWTRPSSPKSRSTPSRSSTRPLLPLLSTTCR